ncbi:MAG: ribonuclease R [Syntrophotaleaceae bacterium]
MPLSPDDLLQFLHRRPGRAMTAREILAAFNLSRKERQEALRLLEKMVEEGLLGQKGRRLIPIRRRDLREGRISLHRDGYGFVSLDKEEGDLFVPARYLGGAMDGDRVAVRSDRRGRSGRPEGQVLQVLERAHKTVVGRFEIQHRQCLVFPADPRISRPLLVDPPPSSTRPGQIVVLKIDTYPAENRLARGHVVEVLGDPEDPRVEIRVIAHKFDLPWIFPEEVVQAAAEMPEKVVEEDHVGREDLRDLPLVTIDGETARDFDDAVAVRRETGGRIRLWVAIADVSHYVALNGAIDREAYERATSVYFPGFCIPMLPEALSNELCSLKPDQDRLAMTAELLFDANGHRESARFYPALIRSRARLTYTEVRDMVVSGDQQIIDRYPDIFPQVLIMEELALRLMAMRRQRGSLDFDLPEAEIVLDLRGRPEDIVRAERNIAHRIIEEFMLAANEAVATWLTEKKLPLLYRIHESPDLEKMQDFQEFMAHLNYGLNLGEDGVEPDRLQKLLDEVEGTPEERVVHHVLLRSMKQARYSPDNAGHFGLAADLYCHFTSPIRRYPDLVVHRLLREALKSQGLPEKRTAFWGRRLPGIAEHTSRNERRAMEAERDVIDLKKCQFMRDKVGEEFPGFISGVQPFGFFVELRDVFVEGLVHVATLKDDYYQYDEILHRLTGQNRRREFKVGEQVDVRLSKVDIDRREMDFELVTDSRG